MSLQRLLMLVALTVIITGLAAGTLSAQSQPASAEVLSSVDSVEPGTPFRIGVRFEMEPGWHIYWRNPGDSGLSTRIQVNVPEGFQVGATEWPLPHRYEEPGGIIAYGYADSVILTRTITPPEKLSQPVKIEVQADWLVCRETCLPGSSEDTLELPVGDGAPSAQARLLEEQRSQLPRPEGPVTLEALRMNRTERGWAFEAELGLGDGLKAVEVFPAPGEDLLIEDVTFERLGEGGRPLIRFRSNDSAAGLPDELLMLITYQDSQGRRGVYLEIFPW